MRRAQTRVLLALLVAGLGTACPELRRERAPAHRIVRPLPELAEIDVRNTGRFLNDLKLSPYWRVTKDRDGHFVAAIRPPWRRGPGGRRAASSPACGIEVVFGAPADPAVHLAAAGQPVGLDVYDDYGHPGQVGPNSLSQLALRLSRDAEVYLVVREWGDDPERKATFQKLPGIVAELAELAADRSAYRVEVRYRDLFQARFPEPLAEGALERFPGSQGRDDFDGYLRSRPGASYQEISLRISHPVICQGECTWEYKRRRKAEYLGTPYHGGDLLYFSFSDNAVYLNETYTRRYGWFSGSEHFEGRIEILDRTGAVLLESSGPFQGWER